jgi:hypothetical protein
MKRFVTFLASLAILWLPFALTCVIAIPVALIGLLLWVITGADAPYYSTKGLLGGMDRAAAGLLGLDPRYTVSAHCGVMTRIYLRPLRRFLDLVAPGHCTGAAVNEGLIHE